jgi:hypothetical protein
MTIVLRLLRPPEWSSASIGVKSDGKWSVFYEGVPRKGNQLTPSRRQPRDCQPLYRHQPYCDPPPQPDYIIPMGDNYNVFRVRKTVVARERVYDDRRPPCPTDIDPPEPNCPFLLKGDDPSRNPFRVSQQLVNERRLAEARGQEVRPATARRKPKKLTHRRSAKRSTSERRDNDVPSLYERSIKPRPDVYEWPRDFCGFPPDEAIGGLIQG